MSRNPSLEFVCAVRPNKRALLERRWWRPRRVVLVLQERGERGWRTLHRTILQDQHEGRALRFATTWLGIDPTHQVILSITVGDSVVSVASTPKLSDTDND